MAYYLAAFFRLVIIFLFLWSATGKLKDFNSFINAIDRFQLVPKKLSRVTAYFFIFLEIAILILLILGKKYTFIGFVVSSFTLCVFTVAIQLVLFRKIKTSCNCFGTSQKTISYFDVFRNMVFILCSIAGGYLIYVNGDQSLYLTNWVLLSMISISFVLIISNLEGMLNY